MNEAKDNKGDTYEQRRPVLVGPGAVHEPVVRGRSQIEPRLEKSDLRLEPPPIAEQTHVPLLPKRKHEGDTTLGTSVSKKTRAGDVSDPNSVVTKKIPRGHDSENVTSDDYESVAVGDVGIPSFEEKDVLCGRGGSTNIHPGNVKFRNLVDSNKTEYLAGNKQTKQRISLSIVKAIRKEGGRFLKQWKDDKWYEVGDAAAREKASQALRQKGGYERKRLAEGESSNRHALLQQQELERMQREQQQRWQEVQQQRQRQAQQHQQQQRQLQQQQELQRQRQAQQEQMAIATASQLGTVAIDPSALMSADPMVLQQALANPVFLALLAMNKVVVPVNRPVNAAPIASMPAAGIMNLEGMGLPAPPVLGGLPLPDLRAATYPVVPNGPATTTITPSPVTAGGNPGVEMGNKQASTALHQLQPEPRQETPIRPASTSQAPEAMSAGYDPLDELGLSLLGNGNGGTINPP